MQKIALLHYSYPPSMGGVELLIQEQAHILASLGYDILVLTGSGVEESSSVRLVVESKLSSILQQNEALQKRFVAEGVMDETFFTLATEIRAVLVKTLADREIIIVHNMATLIHNLPFLAAFKDYVAENPQKKVIIWTHDQTYIDEEKIKYDKEGVNLSVEQKDLFLRPIPTAIYVAISRTFGELLSQVMGIKPGEVKVIPNGVNLQRFFELDDSIMNFFEKERILTAYPLLFSPVNILQRKNLLYSIEIVAELKKQEPNIRYIITGKPSIHRSIKSHLTELQKKIEELQLEESVIFLQENLPGLVPNKLIRTLYSLSDGVLYFSKTENFGLPILEASLLKTPIFVSNLDVFHEIGEDKLTYIDYKTTSPSEAAKIIQNKLAIDSVSRLHAKVRREYNLETIIRTKLVPLFS